MLDSYLYFFRGQDAQSAINDLNGMLSFIALMLFNYHSCSLAVCIFHLSYRHLRLCILWWWCYSGSILQYPIVDCFITIVGWILDRMGICVEVLLNSSLSMFYMHGVAMSMWEIYLMGVLQFLIMNYNIYLLVLECIVSFCLHVGDIFVHFVICNCVL